MREVDEELQGRYIESAGCQAAHRTT